MKYLKAYRALHQRKKFRGYSIKRVIPEVVHMVRDYGARSLLDYGCGQGFQYTRRRFHEAWGILPVLYDPANAAHDKKPDGTFDGVLCTDVLEHIPEEELDATLTEIFSYAEKFVLFAISTAASKKTFPDGSNLHVTVQPEDWWLARIAPFATVPFRAIFH